MISGGTLASNISLSYGLEADAPDSPKQGNQYFCTDSIKLLACAENGSWEEITDKNTRINVMVNALKIATLDSLTLQGVSNGIVDTFTDSDHVTLTGMTLNSGALEASPTGQITPSTTINYDSFTGYPASRVIDGNYNSGAWLADTAASGSFIGVDLGNIKTVDKINLYQNWGVNYAFDSFVIEVSTDNSNWTTIHTETGFYESWATGDNYFEFTAVNARYIRARATNTNGNSHNGVLEEFEVFNNTSDIEVIGDTITLDESISQAHVLVLVDDANLSDTTLSISVDNGATWVECSNLEKITNQNSGYYLAANATISGTGTQLKYKIESQSISTIYGVGLTW